MNDCIFYLVAYFIAIAIAIGCLIGVSLLTEMMIVVQLFATVAALSLVFLWKVPRTVFDFGRYTLSVFLSYLSVIYIGICASLVMSNGTSNIIGGWMSMLLLATVLLTNMLLCQKKSEKRDQFLFVMPTIAFCAFAIASLTLIVAIEPVSPFPSYSVAFAPQKINEKTLDPKYRNSIVSYSRCYAPNCNRFTFNDLYLLTSDDDLPQGFSLEPASNSRYSAVIRYEGNFSLPVTCNQYKIYVQCSPVYTALIGDVWIGKDCSDSEKSPLPCETIDTTVANYLFWFGIVMVALAALFFWLFMSYTLDKKGFPVEMVLVDDYASVESSEQ